MIKISLQKIKNQKWLSICLVLGIALLVAAFNCQPMFEKGSMDKLLQQKFVDYIEENNKYPVVLNRKGTFDVDSSTSVSDLVQKNDEYGNIWTKYVDNINVKANQSYYVLPKISGLGDYKDRNSFYELTYMPEILDHVHMINGTDFSAGMVDGAYPCLISEYVMDKSEFILGERITFDKYQDKDGNMLVLYIAGVFDVNDLEDPYWNYTPYENGREFYISDETFDSILGSGEYSLINYEYSMIFDYTDIDSSKVDNLIYYMDEFASNDSDFNAASKGTLQAFVKKGKSVSVMLWVLEIPILGMVLAFIYMVSRQIVESESAEIAMLKSRGFSRFQIIKMYAQQTSILALFGFILGIPLGYGFCKAAASTTNFLSFGTNDVSLYKFVPVMLLYSLLAVVIGVLFILIPVFQRSKNSIVQQKSNYMLGKRMFWEKYFIDVLLLGFSCYLLYNFKKNINDIRLDALIGSKMDPVIFINTCLFILSSGLVVFRLVHYLVNFIYWVGKKKWKPVSYVSFLQISRTFRNQCFIAVFMIMTVSLGIFNANIARTINENKEERIHHVMASDVITKESWKFRDYRRPDQTVSRRYFEPSYARYEDLLDTGLVDHVTRVYKIPKTTVKFRAKSFDDIKVLGIETKKFGETAYMNETFNKDSHWYNNLNLLAENPDGILVSSNFAEAMGLKIDDVITFYGLNFNQVDSTKVMQARVVGFIDNWPGYDEYSYSSGEEKNDNYLIVGHYAGLVQNFDVYPYEMWYKLSEGVEADELYDYLINNGYNITSFKNLQDEITTMKNTPDIQITNGLFTLSFVIALVLCGVGFLIYWIVSIRKRELLFGVYRAMGLSVKNINGMLILEHLFSTLLSVLTGGVVGMVATLLFVRVFGVVYLPERSNLPIEIQFEIADIVKLFVVLAVMIVVCLMILRRLIKKLNITQALKLGED